MFNSYDTSSLKNYYTDLSSCDEEKCIVKYTGELFKILNPSIKKIINGSLNNENTKEKCNKLNCIINKLKNINIEHFGEKYFTVWRAENNIWHQNIGKMTSELVKNDIFFSFTPTSTSIGSNCFMDNFKNKM